MKNKVAQSIAELDNAFFITWQKGKSLAGLDNLPDPDVLAEEIAGIWKVRWEVLERSLRG
ncbi:MAG: hypothetical protein M3Y85_01210 [Bacteroidota bacterium]|nr:hypothetical protein [Bacteroidota bacterium]